MMFLMLLSWLVDMPCERVRNFEGRKPISMLQPDRLRLLLGMPMRLELVWPLLEHPSGELDERRRRRLLDGVDLSTSMGGRECCVVTLPRAKKMNGEILKPFAHCERIAFCDEVFKTNSH